MTFLTDSDHIDQYGGLQCVYLVNGLIVYFNSSLFLEDIFSFKKDIDDCVQFFSRMRGKKRESEDLKAYISAQLEESFPGVFVSESGDVPIVGSRKRVRQSVEAEDVDEFEPEVKKSSSRLTARIDAETGMIESRLTSTEKVGSLLFAVVSIILASS